MDSNYQGYINRVVPLTLPNNYEQQLQNIQASPKFNQGKPVEFPGFSVITPPWGEEKANEKFYENLEKIQTELVEKLGDKFLIAVPSSSFHLTIVDLIWEKTYINCLKENPNFDQLLIQEMTNLFTQYQELTKEVNNLELEILGLSIFPRAIAICLAPTKASYDNIIKLRELIYQDEKIIKLGIEQQYDYLAHITLGYFGEIESNLDLSEIQSILTEINDQWLGQSFPSFQIKNIELRKFNDMITYIRQPDWATINL